MGAYDYKRLGEIREQIGRLKHKPVARLRAHVSVFAD